MKILQGITKSSLGGAQSVVINLFNDLYELVHVEFITANEYFGNNVLSLRMYSRCYHYENLQC